MNPERFFRPWKKGDRCRVAEDLDTIDYLVPVQVTIAQGTCGTVVHVRESSVLLVQWDGRTELFATSPDSVDPATPEPS